jgi:translation initiation factor 1
MGRLFAGTPWDRPPTCERCGKSEVDCACAPQDAQRARLAPGSQTARLRLEKRARGKLVTVISRLDPLGNDLTELASQLKTKCGTGGTVKEGAIELQGDHIAAAEVVLRDIGYMTKRG